MPTRKIIAIDEKKCNGCGLCIPSCAQGAIQIVDHKARLISDLFCDGLGACLGHCPQGAISIEERQVQWPVQLRLVPTRATYFEGADILITADCVPFAYADFHQDLSKGKILLVGCPKLDDLCLYKDKLRQIFLGNNIKSVTYAHMEVPCCFGLLPVINEALKGSGKKIPFGEITISIEGKKVGC